MNEVAKKASAAEGCTLRTETDEVSVVDTGERSKPLEILHEDEACLVVYKPSGMLVHRTRMDAGEKIALLQTLRDQTGREVHPVHRLDKPTAGVLLLAKSREHVAPLSGQFARGEVTKRYLALVRGFVEGSGTVDYPLIPEHQNLPARKRRVACAAQDAVTDYEGIECFEIDEPVGRYATARYSLVGLSPRHGRRHQLRRHMAHLRHPIIGDTAHGDGKQNRYFEQRFGVRRLMLVATSLSFVPPLSSRLLEISAIPDELFKKMVSTLRQQKQD